MSGKTGSWHKSSKSAYIMRQIFLLLSFVSTFLSACKQEESQIEFNLEIQDPKVTNLPDGRKEVELTFVITQIGNHFLRPFHAEIYHYPEKVLIDSFSTSLPTAREFVFRTIQLEKSGNIWVETSVGDKTGGASSGQTLFIP